VWWLDTIVSKDRAASIFNEFKLKVSQLFEKFHVFYVNQMPQGLLMKLLNPVHTFTSMSLRFIIMSDSHIPVTPFI